MQTVNLDYELHRRVKVKAALEGRSLRDVIDEAVRAVLDPEPKEPTHRPIRRKTRRESLS